MIFPGSYQGGFAPRDFAPAFPQLWVGCVKAYAPLLGPSGATLIDWSGYRQDGTLTSLTLDTAWAARLGTYAIITNGTGYVTDESFLKQPTGNVPFSHFAWVSWTNSAGSIEVASFFGKDGSAQASFLYRSSGGKAVGEFGSGSGSATGTTTLTAGTEYAVCHTYDGANSRIWVNGINEATTSYSSANLANTRHVVGAYLDAGGVTYALKAVAKIREVRIYNRLLLPNEITLLSQRPGISYEYEDSPYSVPAAGGGATAYPWLYYQQMMAG